MNLHPHLPAQIDQLQTFLHQHRRVLVLTGAGLSTASGIPDYRDKDGVRRGRAPIQGPDFRRDVAVQRRCLLYTSPSPRDGLLSRMPSSA